jgi:transposase
MDGGDKVGGNYEKNMYNHLQELIKQVDSLTSEMASMKIRYEKEIDELRAENQQLKKENLSLKAENQKLKDIINKNSGNSSKPPSSDGFNKIQNSREKTGKSPGGQKGHKGFVQTLYENPTHIVELKSETCQCGGRVKYSGKHKAKQLVDIDISVEIIEYREYEGLCECCFCQIRNNAPIDNLITYGNHIKSLSAMLTTEGCVSINRTQQMISEITGGVINLSEGTISKWNKELAGRVEPAIENIKERLSTSPVLHKDETGIRIEKTLNWLHVLCNSTHTLYFSHQKRGNAADKDMDILPSYSGILVHDHLRGLYEFTCTHAECNAHILRYLKAVAESKGRKWAEDMITLLLDAKKGSDEKDISCRYDKILELGSKEFLKEFLNDKIPDYNGDDMKLLRRMKEYKQEHLLFSINKSVPFDNNQAERDLRMIKAKTKISGCFRGKDGGVIFAALKSYTSTLRKNGRNIFEGIRCAFDDSPVLV